MDPMHSTRPLCKGYLSFFSTRRDVLSLKGSATGVESLRMVKERAAENNAKETTKTDKREQDKQKKAVQVVTRVT